MAIALSGQAGGIQPGVSALQTTIGYTPPPDIDASVISAAAAYLNTTRKIAAYGGVADGVKDNFLPAYNAIQDIKTLGRGTLELSTGEYLFVGRELIGGTYVGGGVYGTVGMAFVGANNWRVQGMGQETRILRRDATGTANDKYASFIHATGGCDNWEIGGLVFNGQQYSNIDWGSGGAISINKGCTDGYIHDIWGEECGAGAVVSLGTNRQPGATADRVDRSTPVVNTRLTNINSRNGRYCVFMGIARIAELDGWNSTVASFTSPSGEVINGFLRRSLYVQGVRDVTAAHGKIYGANKTAVLISLYATTTGTLGNAERIHMDDVTIVARGAQTNDAGSSEIGSDTQDADYHNGLYINDENTDPAGVCVLKNSSFTNFKMAGVKGGLILDTSGNTTGTTTPILDNVRFAGFNIQATNAGVNLSTPLLIRDVTTEAFNVSVAYDANYNTASQPDRGFQIGSTAPATVVAGGGTPTSFATGVRVRGVKVRAAARNVRLLGLSKPTVMDCDFEYQDDGVTITTQITDLYMDGCDAVRGVGNHYRTIVTTNEVAPRSSIGAEYFALSPTTAGTLDNVAIGQTIPAAGTFTAVGLGTGAAGSDGLAFAATGSQSYRSSANFRSHLSLNNPNGGVFQIGTTGFGGELRSLGTGGTSKLSDSAGNAVLSWTSAGGLTMAPSVAGTLDNVSVGATTPAAGKFTSATVGTTTAGNDGATLVATGSTSYRNGTAYRAHWNYGNNNGVVGTIGTIANGLALRATATGISQLEDSAGNGVVRWTGDNKLGFFAATPSVKTAITGSRGGNAALAALLTELAAKGLVTDSTTA